jgi:hypothetical protein
LLGREYFAVKINKYNELEILLIFPFAFCNIVILILSVRVFLILWGFFLLDEFSKELLG